MTIQVLVFDEARELDLLAKETLQPLEVEIITANTVALAVFLARKNLPATILCKADSNGSHDLLHEIKADDDLQNIPFLLFFPLNVQQTENAKLLGAQKYVRWPLSAQDFLAEVKPYLHARTAPRPEETPE